VKSFAELFKKYRLRAEFNTFADFSDALAEKGYFYEESIFSHWQKGTRVPHNRELLIQILLIFSERKAIKTVPEANQLLESVGLGYLTEKELERINLNKSPNLKSIKSLDPLKNFVMRIKYPYIVLPVGSIIFLFIFFAVLTFFSASTFGNVKQRDQNDISAKQAIQTLTDLVKSTADGQDLIFDHIRIEVDNIASYTSNIYNNPSIFQNDTYWNFDDRVFQKDGRYLNRKEDISTVHIPNFVILDYEEKRAIDLTANLDFLVPNILLTNKNIAAIYNIDNRGVTRYFPNIILGNIAPQDYDPRGDIYYKNAAPEENPKNEVVWSPLYEDVAGRGLMLTASAPVYTNSGFNGIVGIDVLLKDIIKSINEYEPIKGSYSFLIDKNGETIAFPSQAYIEFLGRDQKKDEIRTKLKANKLTPEFNEVLNKMMNGKKGVSIFKSGNKLLYLGYAPLKQTGFSLAVVVEKEALLKEIADQK
jgi:hypothetical protein